MNTESMIQELRSVAYKNKDKIIHTGQLNISAMCESVIPKLEKLAEYESIGTPDECRAAVEKQSAKKPSGISEEYSFFDCPNCGHTIYASNKLKEHKFCLNCGQAIDWSEND